MRTLKDFAIKTIVNGLALWLAGLVIAGIHFGRGADWTGTLKTVVLVALVFGAVNALIKPILKAVSTPLIWLTLGLFTLVVNAAMLQLTSWFSQQLGLAFHVDEFWWDAVLGALVITFASMILNAILPDGKR
ncbi:MAG: phage holin family protein [Dermatophilaceae bacterium]